MNVEINDVSERITHERARCVFGSSTKQKGKENSLQIQVTYSTAKPNVVQKKKNMSWCEQKAV